MIIERCQWSIEQESGSWPSSPRENSVNVPAMMRRRLTKLGRIVMENLYQNLDFLEGKEIPWIISCQHGDTGRMVDLLSGLMAKEPLSPTDFSLSVHNAIGALFSIATGNKQLQTALSGGKASFEMGLIEAYALQKNKGGRVGFIYYDAPLPPPYAEKYLVPEICISLIIGEPSQSLMDSGSIGLDFKNDQEASLTLSPINEFIRFFKNHDRDTKISIPGGTFLLERIC